MIKIYKYSIGATAAIITSLALIAGLAHGNETRVSIIAGLLIIAIADNVADSLSIHIYKESEGVCKREIYTSTMGNFMVRFILALTFVIIVLLLPTYIALVTSVIWGTFLLIILSYYIAKTQKVNPRKEIAWHLLIAFLVIIGSKLLGDFISSKLYL